MSDDKQQPQPLVRILTPSEAAQVRIADKKADAESRDSIYAGIALGVELDYLKACAGQHAGDAHYVRQVIVQTECNVCHTQGIKCMWTCNDCGIRLCEQCIPLMGYRPVRAMQRP